MVQADKGFVPVGETVFRMAELSPHNRALRKRIAHAHNIRLQSARVILIPADGMAPHPTPISRWGRETIKGNERKLEGGRLTGANRACLLLPSRPPVFNYAWFSE